MWNIIGYIVMLVGFMATILSGYMLWRNEKVYNYRLDVMDLDDMDRYWQLPSYDVMMKLRWAYVWPLSKFENDGPWRVG